MSTYSVGTISVSNASTTVTGTGTAWATSGVQPGDWLIASGLAVRISAVNSATQITLARPWPGSSLTNANYDIVFTPQDQRALAQLNVLLQTLGSGTLTSLAGLSSGPNLLPYWTGVGVMGTTPLTAAARSLLDDADVATMRSTLGLGTAATATVTTSQTDSTTGRLLKVGDFSLGRSMANPVAVPGGNIDAFTIPNGWYWANNTSSGTLPPETAGTYLILQNWFRAENQIFQMAIQRRFSPDRVVVWVRDSTGNPPSGWMPWRRLYSQGDILGAVSQSGGVPTGAVIERGSNSNGEYVRFADGTQICLGRLTNIAIDNSFGSGGLFRSNTFSWTFPATFVAGSINGANLFGRVGHQNGLCVHFPYGGRTTQADDIRAVATVSISSTDVFLTAIGRWF